VCPVISVTGGAGFIGSQLVRALNARGREDLLVADDFEDGRKLANLAGRQVHDVVDRHWLLERLVAGADLGAPVDAFFHQGARADTRDWNGTRMLRDNFAYSKAVLGYCGERGIPLVYASSAAVYGSGRDFGEEPRNEHPLNPYAWSKLLFDQVVRRQLPRLRSQVVGLRYFNVYGPGEAHKDDMASVAYKLYLQLQKGDRIELFEGSHDFGPGEQRRDFVHVSDCVAVNLWFLDHPQQSGIFNVGSGRAQTFNDVAHAVLRHFGRGELAYVPFPPGLRDSYQSYTQADIRALRKAGYESPFLDVEEGVSRYLRGLDEPSLPR